VQVASTVDRLGLAFAAGYSGALQSLLPDADLPCALCVTEAEGNHPRAIRATLNPAQAGFGYVLNGTKTFVTFGNLAQTLIIAAHAGERGDGTPELAVVSIPAERDGVSLQKLPPIPFVPEIPHARVEFENVSVEARERLDGDGYLGYVKPFRTIEDIHVYGATLAYLLGLVNRTRAPSGLMAELVAAIVTLDRLRESAPLDPIVHIAFHGVSQNLDRLFSSDVFASIWDAAPAEERERWERDRKLLRVASTAREARFRKAAARYWA